MLDCSRSRRLSYLLFAIAVVLGSEHDAFPQEESARLLRLPVPEPHPDAILQIGTLFSYDGGMLAAFCAFDPSRYAIWNLKANDVISGHDPWKPVRLLRAGRELLIFEEPGDWKPAQGGVLRHVVPSAAKHDVVLMPSEASTASGYLDASCLLTFSANGDLAACVYSSGRRPDLPSAAFDPALHRLQATRALLFAPSSGAIVRALDLPLAPEEEVGTDPTDPDRVFLDLVFSPDGKKLAAVTCDGRAVVWNCSDGTAVTAAVGDARQIGYRAVKVYREGENPFWIARRHLAWVGNSSILVTLAPSAETANTPDDATGARRRSVLVWDLASATPELVEWEATPLAANPAAVVLGPDAVANFDDAQPQPLRFIACAPDGSRLIVVLGEVGDGNYAFGALEIVDLPGKRAIGQIQVPVLSSVISISFSPDSRDVAIATRSGAIVVAKSWQIDDFARDRRSLIDLPLVEETSERPNPRVRKPSASKAPAPKTVDEADAVARIAVRNEEAEFRLPRTGLSFRTKLEVDAALRPAQHPELSPPIFGIAGVATLEWADWSSFDHVNYDKNLQSFGSELDPVRKRATTFIDEPLEVPGLSARIFCVQPSPKNPLLTHRNYDNQDTMYALVGNAERTIAITIRYPCETAEAMYAPLRAMLKSLRFDPRADVDPFEGFGWTGVVPPEMRSAQIAEPGMERAMTPDVLLVANAAPRGSRSPSLRNVTERIRHPRVWLDFKLSDNAPQENEIALDDDHWLDVAVASAKALGAAPVQESVPFRGTGTVGWELILLQESSNVIHYRVVAGGPIETSGTPPKPHRRGFRLIGAVPADKSAEWIPRFRALAESIGRKESD